MKHKRLLTMLAFTGLASVGMTVGQAVYAEETTEMVDASDAVEIDFAALDPDEQEEAYTYDLFFKPEKDGWSEAYVGDPMPYYEDGTYYIYYLKEGGDSFRHSIYLVTTQDFVTYTEYEDPILESAGEGQEGWIGTGSVVKVDDRYLLFYTAHNDEGGTEFKETIRVAEGTDLTSFTRNEQFELTPPDELGQKNDFRDPQAYYNPENATISLTVTAAQEGVARIQKFTLNADLCESTYDGDVLTDPTASFWNLECTDTFKLGDKWYITYSGQDDTLWYAFSDERFGPYNEPQRIDDQIFYAAKHVESETGSYMVGWNRRSESPTAKSVTAWAGNLEVQQIGQNGDGTLYLELPDQIRNAFEAGSDAELEASEVTVASEASSDDKAEMVFTPIVVSGETFMMTGTFSYSGEGEFGLSFDYGGTPEQTKLIVIDPAEECMYLGFAQGRLFITETAVSLEPEQEYNLTYVQDGAAGVFYIDGIASLSVRLYGTTGKEISLFAQGTKVEMKNLMMKCMQ